MIATGARPFVPPIPGIEQMDCLTSENVWDLRELPRRLVVLGGGPIGSELTQAFARLGSRVTQVEMLPRILMREDPEISAMVMAKFRAEGVEVLVDHKAKQFLLENGQKVLICEHQGQEVRIEFDQLLCAVGRVARTEGYGLRGAGHPDHQGAHHRDQRVPADGLPEHLRLRRRRRDPTSSPIPRRTRPSMPRSTGCSAASSASASTIP